MSEGAMKILERADRALDRALPAVGARYRGGPSKAIRDLKAERDRARRERFLQELEENEAESL